MDRQSFVGMDNTTHYELRQTLNQAIGQAEVAVKQKLLNGGFNPSDCWAYEEKLSKGLRYLERYNHKAILSNISLWFWARFTGKEILAKLSKEAKSGGFKSEQWQVIEKAIVDIYKYGTDTQSLNGSKIGVLVRSTLTKMLNSHEISEEEIALMQTAEYSKHTFDIQYPLLRKASRSNGEKILRYWAGEVEAYGEMYFICSEWYEVPQNNDRPYFMKWLDLHK